MIAGLVLALVANPGALLADHTVNAVLVRGPITVNAPFWQQLPAQNIWVALQRSVRLGDELSNTVSPQAQQVQVKAAHDGQNLALMVEWADSSLTQPGPHDTDVFGDSAALQLPENFGPGQRLPYIGMGDAQSFVRLYLLRYAAGGTTLRESVAAGFGSSTRVEAPTFRGEMIYQNGRWRAFWLRPLAIAPAVNRGRVPFAVAVWDGAGHQRGGNKALSGWHYLRMGGFSEDPKYVDELSMGYRPQDLGDPAKGKILAEGVCAACHHVGERRFAHPALAPDLSAIGLIAHPAYLKESIVAPSAIIVPHLNINRHYNKGAPPDAHGAYPHNEQFIWYTQTNDGQRLSKMPPFASFSSEDLNALVAYLMTLGPTSIPGVKP